MIHTKTLLIGYFSLSESVVKFGLSMMMLAVLPDGFNRGRLTEDEVSLHNKPFVLSEKFFAATSVGVGLIGIFIQTYQRCQTEISKVSSQMGCVPVLVSSCSDLQFISRLRNHSKL